MERTDEKAGKGNFYTAKFWEYGSRTGDRSLPDPVFTPGLSPYAVFGGNPIVNMDPLGDSTIAYNLQGVKIGTLNDNLKNEVHFFNVDADKGAELIKKLNTLDQGEINSWATKIRKYSVAFMGEKSSADLKGIAVHSLSMNKEIVFIPLIDKSREMSFKGFTVPPNQLSSSEAYPPDVLKHNQIDFDGYNKFFGLGHTHITGFTTALKLTGEANTLQWYGQPTNSTQEDRSLGKYNERHDYINWLGTVHFKGSAGEDLFRQRTTPLFIATPLGITIYNNNSNSGDETIRSYNWFKK